ncbi:MAG TPA: hypothetical protein VFI27_12275 [candidate division Zixibacteria bacterium]|nr:hypothetical protein [candidate division Zixibacteria bacterium]
MTPTKNMAPDFKSDSICDILKACKKLNVKRIVLSGCEIEFYPETPEPEPVQSGFGLPIDRMGENMQKAHLEAKQQALRESYEAQELANERQQYEAKRMTPSDDEELKRLVMEQELMMHEPSAWEDMQIDTALGNVKDRENSQLIGDTAGYHAHTALRGEGVQ